MWVTLSRNKSFGLSNDEEDLFGDKALKTRNEDDDDVPLEGRFYLFSRYLLVLPRNNRLSWRFHFPSHTSGCELFSAAAPFHPLELRLCFQFPWGSQGRSKKDTLHPAHKSMHCRLACPFECHNHNRWRWNGNRTRFTCKFDKWIDFHSHCFLLNSGWRKWIRRRVPRLNRVNYCLGFKENKTGRGEFMSLSLFICTQFTVQRCFSIIQKNRRSDLWLIELHMSYGSAERRI